MINGQRHVVGDEPTEITSPAGSDNRWGASLNVRNLSDAVTVDLHGDNTVASGGHYPLGPGESIPMDRASDEPLWAIAPAGLSAEVAVLETGV